MSNNQAEIVSRINEQQMMLNSYSREAGCLTQVDGFLLAKVNRKLVVTYPTNTTELYSFQQGSTVLWQYTATYVDSTKVQISSIERTA